MFLIKETKCIQFAFHREDYEKKNLLTFLMIPDMVVGFQLYFIFHWLVIALLYLDFSIGGPEKVKVKFL